MVADVNFPNAFAADGIIPGEYGLRTVVEYRSQLFNVPGQPENGSHRPQAEDNDVDMITPVTNRKRPTEAGLAPRLPDGSLQQVDPAECEHALRVLGNMLDITGLGTLDPKYLGVLRVDRPMFIGGRTRPMLASPASIESPGVVATIRNALSSFLASPRPSRDPEMSIVSWHWAEDLIAVVAGAHLDRICAYNFNTNRWETAPNRIEALDGIRCIAFRPFSGRVLAIGCAAGVALLKGPDIYFLKAPGHTNIVSLDWSPDGSKLATASAADGKVRLWDVGTRESVVIDNGAIVRFSRGEGRLLFISSAHGTYFRLWEWELWKNERWGLLSGPVTAVTWSPDGMTLLFSTEGESAIHVISIAGPGTDDETRVVHTEITTLPREGPGGTPVLLEMDCTGERLAVAYEHVRGEAEADLGEANEATGDPKRRYAVALYAMQLYPTFRIQPIGHVSGPENSGPPVGLKFKPKDDINKSTILSCMWRSGDVTFTQLLFSPLRQGL